MSMDRKLRTRDNKEHEDKTEFNSLRTRRNSKHVDLYGTPTSKFVSKRNLNPQDISAAINSSEDEFEIPKAKITTRKSNAYTPSKSGRVKRNVSIKSLNEDDLFKEQEEAAKAACSTPKKLKNHIYEHQSLSTYIYNTPKQQKITNTPKKSLKSVSSTPNHVRTLHIEDSPATAISKLRINGTPARRSILRNHPISKENDSAIGNTPRSTRRLTLNIKDEKVRKSPRKRPATPEDIKDADYVMDQDQESDDSYESENTEEDSESEFVSTDEDNDDIIKKKLKTPRKSLKSSLKTPSKKLLTPKVHERIASIAKPSTPLQEARLKLHVSVLPKSLPCREEQFNDIYTFLHARLSDCSGGCIYVSGVPGTGKTATVNEVIRCLKKSMNAGKLNAFEFVDINGMKLSEPRQAYVQIWKQLTGNTVSWEQAQKSLLDRFTKNKYKKGMTLLLVDELDLLCTKRQDVVYNLLDWPSKAGAKLVVITIANTMDLPERILMGKVTSRLGLTRLTFPPYNYKQLEEIVVSRLKGYNAFSGETVQLIARKVAAVSGDARRALDICRRATEVAETNNREIVTMTDVQQALNEMIASPKIQAIKHCSDMEKLFLQAVCAEVTRTGVEEVVFKNVYFEFESLCTFEREPKPNITMALGICARLGSWRLLLCEHSRLDIHQRLLLNVSADDVHYATQIKI